MSKSIITQSYLSQLPIATTAFIYKIFNNAGFKHIFEIPAKTYEFLSIAFLVCCKKFALGGNLTRWTVKLDKEENR